MEVFWSGWLVDEKNGKAESRTKRVTLSRFCLPFSFLSYPSALLRSLNLIPTNWRVSVICKIKFLKNYISTVEYFLWVEKLWTNIYIERFEKLLQGIKCYVEENFAVLSPNFLQEKDLFAQTAEFFPVKFSQLYMRKNTFW